MDIELIIYSLSGIIAGITTLLLSYFYRNSYPCSNKTKILMVTSASLIAYLIGALQPTATITEISLEMLLVGPLTFLIMTDITKMELPDEVNFSIFIMGLIYTLLTPHKTSEGLFTGFIMAASLLAVALLKGGMGGGDIKYVFAIGLWFSPALILPYLNWTVFPACIYAVTLLTIFKRNKTDEFAFGPFLIAATFITLLMN